MNETKAFADLARANVSLLHLAGTILAVLVERRQLTSAQARAIAQDAKDRLNDDNPFHEAYARLVDEFPG